MSTSDFPGSGLSEAQWDRLRTLATSLTTDQSAWVAGYFTGYADAARGRPELPAPGPAAAAPPPAPPAARRTLTVLYASETGTGIEMGEAAAAYAASLGLAAMAVDVEDYEPARLTDEEDLLVVTSTHGEGDPPQPALGFFEFVAGGAAPRLETLRFAVLALGDSTYEFFCRAGRTLDARLAELGATRLAPRIDCDVDQLRDGRAWARAVIDGLAAAAPSPAPVAARPAAAIDVADAHDEANPVAAEIVGNVVITGPGSSKETRHLALRLGGSGLTYEPGDALGIVGRNDRRVVDALLAATDLVGAAAVTVDGRPMPLAVALERHFEICGATPRFIAHWAALSGAAALKALAEDADAAARVGWLRAHHVIDIVRDFPVAGLDAQSFVAGLRRLQPRLYSIASSAAVQHGDAHLTITTVRYALNGSERRGVVSGGLGALAEGATLPVYVRPTPHFHLPADDVPIIMIGAGTGVAPYRGFVQERQLRGASGRSWLIFGDRNSRTDFLYRDEWQAHRRAGGLSLIDAVFSRDGARKTYVQDRVRERGKDLYAWLQDGAHLYVCGDAEGMAPGVHQALIDAVATAGQLGAEAAADYVFGLQKTGRYHKDVY
jgi:sulfite reductase (NADPH) flavoprotein alpha-component